MSGSAALSQLSSSIIPSAPLWETVFESQEMLRQGRFDEARRLLDSALKISRAAPWVRLLRFRARRVAGLSGWMRDLDTAFRADARCGWVFGLEEAPSCLGPQAARLSSLSASFTEQPACAPVFAYRGQAKMFRGDVAGGLRDLERASVLESSGWILSWLGEAYRRAGDSARAEAVISRGLTADPRYANGYAWRATARMALGRLEEARGDLDRALHLSPTARAWMDRARLLRAMGRMGECLDDLERAVRLNPELTWGGRDSEGLSASVVEIEQALRLYPAEKRLAIWLGDTLLRLGRAQEALQALTRAAADCPGSALAFSAMAQARLECGQEAAMVQGDLRRAFELEPEMARAHWVGACLAAREGRPRQALEHLDAAIRRWRFGARLYEARAGLLESLGRRSAARRDRERRRRLCPDAAWGSADPGAAWSSRAWP